MVAARRTPPKVVTFDFWNTLIREDAGARDRRRRRLARAARGRGHRPRARAAATRRSASRGSAFLARVDGATRSTARPTPSTTCSAQLGLTPPPAVRDARWSRSITDRHREHHPLPTEHIEDCLRTPAATPAPHRHHLRRRPDAVDARCAATSTATACSATSTTGRSPTRSACSSPTRRSSTTPSTASAAPTRATPPTSATSAAPTSPARRPSASRPSATPGSSTTGQRRRRHRRRRGRRRARRPRRPADRARL